MRPAINSLCTILLAAATGCFCPLWDQGCGGKIELPGVDYVKYSGIVKNAVTGEVIQGVNGGTITFYFPNRPETQEANLDGTFTLFASTTRLPKRVSVSAPGYETWASDLAQSGAEVKLTALLKPIAQQ